MQWTNSDWRGSKTELQTNTKTKNKPEKPWGTRAGTWRDTGNADEPTEWSKNTDLNIQLTKNTEQEGKKTKTGNVKHKERDFNIKQEMKKTKTQDHDKNNNGTVFFLFDIKN